MAKRMTVPATRRDDDDERMPWGERALMIVTLSMVLWLGIAALADWLCSL